MKTTAASELRVLARGLAVLECFSTRPSLSLTDVATATHLPVATAWRLLHGLLGLGYLTQTDAKRYQASARMLALARGSLGPLAFLNLYPRLGALAAETGVGWVMHVLDGLETVIVAFGFAHPVPMDASPMGERHAILSQALGRAILAHMPQPDREAILDGLGVAPDSVERRDLATLLCDVASEGLAAMDNPPIASAAAPIFNFNGRPLAAIGVIAYSANIDAQRLAARWGKTVKAVAREFSQELGYGGP